MADSYETDQIRIAEGGKMMRKTILCLLLTLCLVATVFAGCATAPTTQATTAPTDAKDRVLKVALILADTVESIYNRALYSSLMKLKDEGDKFELNYIENVTADNVTSVIRSYADQKYDVIIGHAGISRDTIYAIHKEYPDIAFLGGGYERLTPAPNVGAYDQAIHEACYLLGVIAGMITKSNVIGFVASKPLGNVTSLLHAYERGAKSVNKDIKVLSSYIESFYDPVKAKEQTNAQISQGADIVFGERDGVIQACQEAGIYAMAEKIDQSSIAPQTVLACASIRWESTFRDIFADVRAGRFKNMYYTKYVGSYAEGTCALDLSKTIAIPQNIQDKLAELDKQLKDNKLVIPFEP
jgi:basic membrane lipoprotein Med (substrate-binding protein (PBP1-ABC) superfamily)